MSELKHVGQSDFEQEVLNADIPVLVDFTAVWCGPCKMLEPVVKELSQELDGKVKIVKLDVDENQELAMQYGVMGVPTLMLFVNGEEKQRMTGYQPKKRILSKLESVLS